MAGFRNSVWDDLITEFPVLTDPQNLHFGNRKMRDLYLRQLLEKCNQISRIPFTMEMLKKKLKTLNRRRNRRQQRQGQSGEDSRGECWLDQGTCADSTEPTNQIQRVEQEKPEQETGLFNIVFHCCGVCGEIKGECSKGIDKSYIENNKTTLAMNNLNLELDFNNIMVCQNCDVKLKEMYEFVKLVSSAQYKFGEKIVNIDLTEIDMPINSVTVTDTELVKPTIWKKRKCEETPEVKKKCRVTNDLNISDDDRSTINVIEVKYEMFKKGEVLLAKSADKVSKAVTVNNEDAILKLKKKIEQDLHNGANVTREATDDDRRNDIEIELTTDRKYENSEDIILDVKKEDENNEDIILDVKTEIVSDAIPIPNEVNETGEIVTDDGTECTCDSEKTNATASNTSELANKGEPMCVMPQGDLILLVESVVSRMFNK